MARVMSEHGVPYRDEAAQAAAIAAMGYRLAAASSRSRQRLRDRRAWQDDASRALAEQERLAARSSGDPDIYWPPEVSEDPASGWSWDHVVTAVRRSTVLATAASFGFGLVLIGLNMSVARRGAGPGARLQTQAVAEMPAPAQPQVQAEPAPTLQFLAAATLQPPAAVEDVTSLSDPGVRAFAQVLPPVPVAAPAATRQAATLALPALAADAAVPAAPKARAERFAATLAARGDGARATALQGPAILPRNAWEHRSGAARGHAGGGNFAVAEISPAPPLRMRSWRPQVRAVRVVLARAVRPVVSRDFDVPRWLAAEPAPTPPRALILSPPPHNLVHPPDSTPAPAAPAVAPAEAVISAAAEPLPEPRPTRPAYAPSPPPVNYAAATQAYRPYYAPPYGGPGPAYYPSSYGPYYGNPYYGGP